MCTDTPQPPDARPQHRSIDFPALRGRDPAGVQPQIEEDGFKCLVVDVLLDSAEGDGDEVPRLLGDGELEFNAGFRGAVRGR